MDRYAIGKITRFSDELDEILSSFIDRRHRDRIAVFLSVHIGGLICHRVYPLSVRLHIQKRMSYDTVVITHGVDMALGRYLL